MIKITPREKQIAKLAAQGKNNREIAEILKPVAITTIKNHIHSLILKTNSSNRTGAIVRLLNEGIITTDKLSN